MYKFVAAVISAALIAAYWLFPIPPSMTEAGADPGLLRYVQVDPAGPRAPWGKAVGDINGDGIPDLIVGGHQPRQLRFVERVRRKLGIPSSDDELGELVWYASPAWEKHVVSTGHAIRTDIEIGDIDGDGRMDIVAVTDDGIGWFRNPDWNFVLIDSQKMHDIELADIDGDSNLEIVARNQSLFGYNNGNKLLVYDQTADGSWVTETLAAPHGEGLLVTDLNSDGRPDIAVNNSGYYNTKSASGSVSWQPFTYSTTWQWNDVFVGTGDFDNDGNIDIVLTPAEPAGQRYRISWFRSPGNSVDEWEERVVVDDTETVHHFVGVADFDGDGLADIATSQMTQGAEPHEVAVYFNHKDGRIWRKQILSTSGSHSMRIVDADGDGYPDLFGANWQKDDYFGNYSVDLWINRRGDEATSKWKRHVIDANRPGQAIFVFASDIDGDNQPDIATGAWWYRNPGIPSATWERSAIGNRANNVVLIHDFDGDGQPDLLASNWRGYQSEPSLWQKLLNRSGLKPYDYRNFEDEFVWARNAGAARFEIHDNIERANGDFLQGASMLRNLHDEAVLLSFHDTETALQMLRLPENRIEGVWTWVKLSPHSQHEQVSTLDIDGDGFDDIILGTQWLQAGEQGQSWSLRTIYRTQDPPDRHSIGDLNGDGRPDIVIGYEAISRTGRLAWYEAAGPDPTHPWIEHPIAELIGPMSIAVTDMDGDGDLDVIAGEHNLANPHNARLFWFENVTGAGDHWKTHLVYIGDEHHNGALAIDIDGDGDIDIVSIGWGHNRVVLYENLRSRPR